MKIKDSKRPHQVIFPVVLTLDNEKELVLVLDSLVTHRSMHGNYSIDTAAKLTSMISAIDKLLKGD